MSVKSFSWIYFSLASQYLPYNLWHLMHTGRKSFRQTNLFHHKDMEFKQSCGPFLPEKSIESDLPVAMRLQAFEPQITSSETLPICVVLDGVWMARTLKRPHLWQVDWQPHFGFAVRSAANPHGEAGAICPHAIERQDIFWTLWGSSQT